MLLSFDIASDQIAEHDDWHTHEHLPERLSIPGFLRGTRWIAAGGPPRYVVLYEVAKLDTLTSAAYLERLNQPTPWTARMMPHYRGMIRGLCAVTASFGVGIGHLMYVIRFEPVAQAEVSVHPGLLQGLAAAISMKPGLGSVHLLTAAASAPMTHEQRIRGRDASVDSALLLMGYEPDAVLESARALFDSADWSAVGARVDAQALYRLDYVLTHADVAA
jgi:hypothetical protein